MVRVPAATTETVQVFGPWLISPVLDIAGEMFRNC